MQTGGIKVGWCGEPAKDTTANSSIVTLNILNAVILLRQLLQKAAVN